MSLATDEPLMTASGGTLIRCEDNQGSASGVQECIVIG